MFVEAYRYRGSIFLGEKQVFFFFGGGGYLFFKIVESTIIMIITINYTQVTVCLAHCKQHKQTLQTQHNSLRILSNWYQLAIYKTKQNPPTGQ